MGRLSDCLNPEVLPTIDLVMHNRQLRAGEKFFWGGVRLSPPPQKKIGGAPVTKGMR